MNTSRFSHSAPFLIAGILAFLAGLLPASLDVFRSAIFLFALVFVAGTVGGELAPRLPRAVRWIVSGATLLAGQAIIQTIWYYAGGTLGAVSDGVSLGGSIWLLGALLQIKPLLHHEELVETPAPTINSKLAAWTVLSVLTWLAASLFLLVSASQHATTSSINSPWTLFPDGTFVAVAVLFASTFLASLKAPKIVSILLTGLTFLTLASFTVLIYPLGYGFDGFLHRASEEVILRTGTLTPPPPAYIGQYTFITWLTRVLRIPYASGDTWFLGGLALLLPLAAAHLEHKKRASLAVVSLLLALPLTIFAATTPQNVAYVLGLLALLWFIPQTAAHPTDEPEQSILRSVPLAVPWLFLGWSLATHPLAGLPFAFVGFAFSLQLLRFKLLRRILTGVSLISALLAVPLAFSVRAFLQGGTWSWSWLKAVPSSLGWFIERFREPATHLAIWPDWANWQTYLFTFVLLGAALYAAHQDTARRRMWALLIAFAFAASGSSWLLQTSGDFSFLISYERQDYAGRLLVVAQLFLVPAALVGLAWWFERIEKTHPRMRAAALLLGLAWFTANVYNMLPRNDAAAIGHGWNVGRSDLEAVQFIEKQANGEPYTVLANQTVSAAAISAFGFKRYVGDVFFYPIPTGGPLYEQFIQMMDRPSLDIAREAGQLGQSQRVYVVVNRYWFKSEQTIEQLKGLADRTWNVERGAAYIFLFDLNTSTSAPATRSGA